MSAATASRWMVSLASRFEPEHSTPGAKAWRQLAPKTLHPLAWQKLNARALHEFLVTDRSADPLPFLVLLPVRPGPVRVLVIHQLEQVGRHHHRVVADTRSAWSGPDWLATTPLLLAWSAVVIGGSFWCQDRSAKTWKRLFWPISLGFAGRGHPDRRYPILQ